MEIQQILESLIPIAGIVFGTLLTGYVFGKIIGLIKAWINRNQSSYDEATVERLAKAFIQHKKDSERRFQNLEAIVTDDDSKPISSGRSTPKKQHQSIEIESDHSDEAQEEHGNLKNMLNKKRSR